jgi:hypothetical protein
LNVRGNFCDEVISAGDVLQPRVEQANPDISAYPRESEDGIALGVPVYRGVESR